MDKGDEDNVWYYTMNTVRFQVEWSSPQKWINWQWEKEFFSVRIMLKLQEVWVKLFDWEERFFEDFKSSRLKGKILKEKVF